MYLFFSHSQQFRPSEYLVNFKLLIFLKTNGISMANKNGFACGNRSEVEWRRTELAFLLSCGQNNWRVENEEDDEQGAELQLLISN